MDVRTGFTAEWVVDTTYNEVIVKDYNEYAVSIGQDDSLILIPKSEAIEFATTFKRWLDEQPFREGLA